MSEWCDFTSEFYSAGSFTEEEMQAHINEIADKLNSSFDSNTFDYDVVPHESFDSYNIVDRVYIDLHESVSSGSSHELNELWIEVVKQLADLSGDPVEVTTNDENDRPVVWYIGRGSAVVRKQLRDISLKIKELKKQRRNIQKQLEESKQKPDEFYVTEH